MATANRKVTGRISGVTRIEENLRKSNEAKDFYESHQFYVTLNHRYHSRGKYVQARELITEGATFFFQHKQYESGLHLALLYVESLEKHVKKIDPLILKVLGSLHKMIPNDLADFENFQNRAIRWSASCADTRKTGDGSLRKEFAVNLWNAGLLGDARQQFLYSDDGALFGEMLVEFSISYGHPEECDLFLVQAILQLLAIKSVGVAKDVFRTYIQRHPKLTSTPPFNYPLVNFLFFLFNAIDSKKPSWYQSLVEVYQKSLMKRDPTYNRYLSAIGATYFDLKSKSNGRPNKSFFENIFQDFLGADGESDVSDDDGELETAAAAVTIEDDLD